MYYYGAQIITIGFPCKGSIVGFYMRGRDTSLQDSLKGSLKGSLRGSLEGSLKGLEFRDFGFKGLALGFSARRLWGL